jgi:hypothetical protein
MSDAADRLARSRLAILDEIQPVGQRPRRGEQEGRSASEPGSGQPRSDERRGGGAGGWFARIKHAASTWWRHHPAHMGLELATPVLSDYAGRKPLQYLGIAAAVGAVLMIARPWRLISVTGLLVAIVKSSQLSTVLLSALSAADYRRDHEPHD